MFRRYTAAFGGVSHYGLAIIFNQSKCSDQVFPEFCVIIKSIIFHTFEAFRYLWQIKKPTVHELNGQAVRKISLEQENILDESEIVNI